MKKNGGFWEEHGEFEKSLKGQDNEQLNMFEGKLKRSKKLTKKHKTRVFRDWVKSRTSGQDKSWDTWDEIFEKFVYVFFTTGSSTRKEVAKGATKISV